MRTKRQVIKHKAKPRRTTTPRVRQSAEQREERRLVYVADRPTYVAVSEHGYGVDMIAAMAIRKAQINVPYKAKPSQLLIYAFSGEAVEPVGFDKGTAQWPNGIRPRLVGLTNTHQGFRQKPH